MKNLLFVTGCFPEGTQQYYLDNSINPYSLASNVLSWRLIEGFDAIDNLNLTIFSCPFVPFYPKDYRKPFLKSYEWNHKKGSDKKDKVIGCFNLKYLGIFHKSIKLKKQICRWLDKSEDNRHILFYSNDISFMRIVNSLKKKCPEVKITVLITDLNEFDRDPIKPRNFKQRIKKMMFDYRINTVYSNMDHADSFVLLADKMREFIRIGDRPYVICEGICNSQVPYKPLPKNEGTIKIFYSGNLHERYGILNVIQAVVELGNMYKLTICGDGDSRAEVEKYSREHDNIDYLGMLPNEKVIALQQDADLLVNSMPNFGRHTELSFPSKIMEYMVQGRPVMCHKVPGIPDEYDEYLLYFENNTIPGIKNSLRRFKEMSFDKKKFVAINNRQFIIEKKNQFTQTQRIFKLIYNE